MFTQVRTYIGVWNLDPTFVLGYIHVCKLDLDTCSDLPCHTMQCEDIHPLQHGKVVLRNLFFTPSCCIHFSCVIFMLFFYSNVGVSRLSI